MVMAVVVQESTHFDGQVLVAREAEGHQTGGASHVVDTYEPVAGIIIVAISPIITTIIVIEIVTVVLLLLSSVSSTLLLMQKSLAVRRHVL